MSKMLRNYQYLVGNNLDRSFEGSTLKEYVEGVTSTAVTGLLGMAPEELDTLGELSSAIQNNPDFPWIWWRINENYNIFFIAFINAF